MAVVFVDTETTGLDPDRHEIWEVALIDGDTERVWHLPTDLAKADLIALNIGGWFDRYNRIRIGDECLQVTPLKPFAGEFMRLTRGKHLVGAVVSFDAERLARLLRANGCCPAWHYHLVDVEALAAGKLGVTPPWDSQALAEMVGVDRDDPRFEKHTALGDARWAKAIYEAVLS